MKVLVFAGAYPSDRHPAKGAFVREHARAVAVRHDVVVLCHDGPALRVLRAYRTDEERRDGLRTIRLRTRPRYRNAVARVLDDLAREGFRPDVVHAHFYYVAALAVPTARERGLPLVLSEHSSAFPTGRVIGAQRAAAEAAFGAARAVCPVSEFLRDSILAAGFEIPMTVVPNPIDTEAFAPGRARPRGGPPVIIAVAGLTALKGLDLLIDAVAATEARLVVVGDGAQRRALELRARSHGAADRIEFRGELPKIEVARALAEADLFCLPSLVETHGVAFIEAIATGLPVLGTRVGGIPEIVGPGDGELIPPGDPAALAAALERMLAGLDRYDRAAIRRRAAGRFGYPRVAAMWDQVYADALA